MYSMTRLRNFGLEAVGWILLGLAIVALPLPVIPSLLLLAALVFLSARYSWASRLLQRTRRFLSIGESTASAGTSVEAEHL